MADCRLVFYNIYTVPKTLSVQIILEPLPIVLPTTSLIVKVQMKHAMKHDFCNVHVRELNCPGINVAKWRSHLEIST